MPSPSSGVATSIDSPPSGKRRKKREGGERIMSPEDETTASPPAGLIAGREEEERRVSSPPSGSKFLDDQKTDSRVNDDASETAAMIQRGAYDDTGSTDDEKEKMSFEESKCPTKDSFAEDSWGTSDVEKFDGKIVYNPDGSAYIIEDSELSEDDSELPQIIGDGCIVDGPGVNLSQVQALPQIANAFYVSRNPALYNALYGSYANKLLHDKKIVPEAPIMHSYRVYTVRDNRAGDCNDSKREEKKQSDCSSVPVKPILMCFICKLSFGYAKSFVAHAMGDHNVVLRDDEKDILGHKNASAIIQCVGKEKEPLVSFLEPLSPVLGTPTSASTTTTTDGNSSQLLNRSSSPGYSEAESQHVPKDPVPSAVDGSSEFDDEKVCAESLVVHQRDSSPKPVHTQNVPETLVSLPQNGSCVNISKDNITISSSSSSNSNNINSSVSSLANRESSGLNCVMDLTRKSPISASAAQSGSSGRGSGSPGASPSPGTTLSPLLSSAVPYPQPPPNFLTGTTIGVCPDHMGGRPSGVECAKCELILSSSRLGGVGGPLAGMHSRNSCKTLKCPKCNWHYKYQETLEIHMKEKHPETETSCIYCIAGQPHPRLARGETYTCGYKPYRCEVCNYSTTTKGNLSIHMQSDKHLNNMQELQNGGGSNSERMQQTPPPSQHKPSAASPVTGGAHHPGHSPISSQQSQKPKPTFRCDVCNYETNVARNLRIHMTSEKHTHNMMVLQQNVKHMQTLSAIQQSHHQQQLGFESLLHFHPSLALPGGEKPPHAEAAMADMAYNQALLIQMMTGGQLPPHLPPELAPHMDMGLNPETMEPPPEPADPNPEHLFHCCVCNNFSTDSLEALTHHLAADRTKIREQEILAVVAGHYVCKLCTYKTNLKANFQLHCKTDKHLQRLQHVNHVKEGGPRNEWKLKYLSSPGGVQVRCHACDYYTNSAHKLQLHSAGQRHEVSGLLFRHIRDSDGNVYRCVLCGFSSRARLPLLQHARSMKHLQMEQLHQLQRRSEGKDVHADISEVFQVLNQPSADSDFEQEQKESGSDMGSRGEREEKLDLKDLNSAAAMMQLALEQQILQQKAHEEEQQRSNSEGEHACPYCNYATNSEMRLQAHVLAQHSQSDRPQSAASSCPNSPAKDFLCPLCQDSFKDKLQLEKHVMQIHSVNSEGLQRLLMLVDQSHWLNATARPSQAQHQTPPGHHLSPSSIASSGSKDLEKHSETNSRCDPDDRDEPHNLSSSEEQCDNDENRCQACSKNFRNLDELYSHQNESGHLEIKQTPSGPGYLCWKKGCNQYFPSANSLQMHFREIHSSASRNASLSQSSVSTVSISEKHVYKYRCNQCSLAFKTMEKLQLHSQYHLIRDATKCVLCGRSFRSILALHKHVETSHTELSEDELNAYKQSLMNNPLLLAGISGQVLDPSTNELLRKESMKGDSEEMEIDESPSKDSVEDGAQGNDGENSDDSIIYKEQQFLEDYLNSQAIAEDTYNDPNRKYKCHRCKVAFTRQGYLTSHNKTLLHRKGEKLSYPMEKYLDPNRPYKCDVCKESFTQKNILLVHYNSVSHLHKLKRAMQEQQNNNNNNSNNNNNNTAAMSPHAAAVAVAASLGVSPPSSLLLSQKSSLISEDDDKKPFKCNICKVAYTQGSNLDIHLRSVLHQTRASKLQDLALSGQIDLSKPLIEQPEPQKVQDQHKKLMQDILSIASSPKQQTSPSPSSGVANQVPSPNQGTNIVPSTAASSATSVPTSLTNSSPTNQTSVIPSTPNKHGMLSCQRCSALFANQDQLNTHQQLYCLFGSPMSMFHPLPTPPHSSANTTLQSPRQTPPPMPLTPFNDEPLTRIIQAKKSSHMYKHLLESFGFDLVMQFNENHQRRQKKEKEESEKLLAELHAVNAANNEPETVVKMEEEVKEQDVSESKEEEEMKQDEETSNSENLPEVSKSTCQHCNKEFSSVWVLKAHCEEVHKDLVPLDFLEKYAHQIKCEYEKKVVPTTTTPPSTTTTSSVMNTPSTISSSAVTSSSPDITPEKEHDDNKEELHAKLSARESQHSSQHENPNPPSTPTAPSTPASSTDSIPPNVSSSTPSNQSGPMPMNLAQQMNEMQAALNAMAASQLQQQLQQFNPMMMGMAGLGMGLPLGLNMPALAAMNLQPPLVPMMMPPPPFEPMVGGQNPLFSPQSDHSSMMSKQQQQFLQQHQQQQAAQATANASQQKRARTRITDDQLKILRAHFDINNSPSEEQIHEMAAQSGLPPKVIKHWFRNTLFKERQRNKDSPYNFNNPPSTTLNLEEYEKTGEAKVMPLPSADNLTNDDVVSASTITVKKSADAGKDQPSSGSSSNSTLSLQMKKKQQQAQQAQQISEAQNFLTQAFQQAIKKEPSEIKTEPEDDFHRAMESHHHKMNPLNLESLEKHSNENQSGFEQKSPLNFQQTFRQDCHRDTVASPPLSPSMNDRLSMNTSGSRSSPENLTLTSIIASQLGPNANTTSHSNLTTMTVSTANNMLPPKITPPNFTSPSQLQQSPTSVSIPPATRSLSPARSLSSSSDCFNPSLLSGVGGNSNGSNSSSGSTGKRANRTRFTDYQIKVLQEFFENNAYPKDDDLEYLSKLLSLSPRVIVVWFQNARQKARKVYENQPPVELSPGLDETGAGRFQRTPGLNYQCKKCLLVFQRYYELIRHQKTHCFKEEDAKRSAQAQAAAAQIAAVLSSEDSNSSTVEQNQQALQLRETATSSNPPTPAAPTTPTPSLSMYPPSPAPPSTPTPENKDTSFQCDNCNLVFPRFELWREHQLVHIMNPNLFPSYPPDSPFGILQQHAQMQQQQQQQQQEQQQQQQQQREQQQQHQQQQQREQHQSQSAPSQQSVVPSDLSTNSSPPSPHPFLSMLNATKRKFEEYDFMCDRDGEQPKDKRLRTTILPEQLDYLYQKYQVESNPSRKMLENIAREVGLKKRVVQVWFQNTRARERKGQFRAHSQVINKRCPFCPALFKVKSALESHLTTKHPEQCGRGEINIDSLPDEELSMESAQSFQTAQANEMRDKFEGTQNMAQPMFQGGADIENFKKYYEESMKRYISELQTHQQLQNGGPMPENLRKGEGETTTTHGESPLDLSKPVDLSRQIRMHFDERNAEMNDMSDDDSMSEATDFMDGDESNPTSPASSTQSNQMNKSGSMSNSKRYRTQMTSLQVKVMKSLFGDYKTPTMSECEMLGREIGLPKRVIQVWFQNARAKDKKYKLSSHKGGDDADENPKTAEDCKFCQFKYSHKYSVQDHIFTKKHIDMVKAYLEARLSQKELNSGHVSDGEFTVPPAPDVAAINHNNNSTSPNQQQLAQLQILQMSQAMALAAAKDPSSLTPEDVALLHQLYGLGLPQGLPLHPALISAAAATASSRTGATVGGDIRGGREDPARGRGGPDSGTPISQLQLSSRTLQKIISKTESDASVSEVIINSNRNSEREAATAQDEAADPLLIRTGSGDGGGSVNISESPEQCENVRKTMGFVCKKCKLAFPEEPSIINHLKSSDCSCGVVRLVQSDFICKICPPNVDRTFSSLSDWKTHFGKIHSEGTKPDQNLSDEMEDVVNQITALAAKAAAQSSPNLSAAADSNANIFCTQPGSDTSKLFRTPNSVAVPSTISQLKIGTKICASK